MSCPALLDHFRRRRPVIAPSMLKCDFGNLHREVELLQAAGAEVLHLDVMDGHFVPNLSYGPMVIERLRPLTALPFDAHLMISEPGRYLEAYVAAGCQAITFHVEAVPDCAPLLERVRRAGCLAGIALNPETPVSAIDSALTVCDLVLVMSVEPGFGGQQFRSECLEKVRSVRQRVRPGTLVSIDGGIGPDNIAAAAEAGADVFVVGSAIFDRADYGEALRALRQRSAAALPTAAGRF
jgi:ribulose-phosphate 3-epimerase